MIFLNKFRDRDKEAINLKLMKMNICKTTNLSQKKMKITNKVIIYLFIH